MASSTPVFETLAAVPPHDPSVKQKADWLWALSKLTLPHAMVRVLLAEQLYRAHSVISNHPYHRE